MFEMDMTNNGSLAQTEDDEEDDNLMNLSVNDGASESEGEGVEEKVEKPISIE